MQEKEKSRERFRKEMEGVFRAVSSHPKAQVTFPVIALEPLSSAYYMPGTDTVILPLPQQPSKATVAWARGEADAIALKLKYHRHLPEREGVFYNRMEEVRCEALGASAMAGIAQNLAARMNSRIREKGWDTKGGLSAVPAMEVAAMLAWEALGHKLPEAAKLMRATLGKVMEMKIRQELKALPSVIRDQRAYAEIVARIAERLAGGSEENAPTHRQKDAEGAGKEDAEETGAEGEQLQPVSAKEAEVSEQEGSAARGMAEDMPQASEEASDRPSDRRKPKGEVVQLYTAYATQFDRIVPGGIL